MPRDFLSKSGPEVSPDLPLPERSKGRDHSLWKCRHLSAPRVIVYRSARHGASILIEYHSLLRSWSGVSGLNSADLMFT